MNIQENESHGIDICNNYKDGLNIGIDVLKSQHDVTSMSNTLYPIKNIRVAQSVANINSKFV